MIRFYVFLIFLNFEAIALQNICNDTQKITSCKVKVPSRRFKFEPKADSIKQDVIPTRERSSSNTNLVFKKSK